MQPRRAPANPVATSKSCSFTVTFTPTNTIAYSDTLNVNTGTSSPALPLALTGTGVQQLYLSTSTLSFGNQGVNVTSASKTVTLYNYSGVPIYPTLPSSTSGFAVGGGASCPGLATNSSCTFTVTFTPTALGLVGPIPLSVVVGSTSLPLTATGTGVQQLYLSVYPR